MAKGDREREIEIINQTQDEYENQLISKLLLSNSVLRTINFTSPTGTGKTKMMADIIEKMNTDFFFVITTLSKGQLKFQIDKEISRFTKKDNFIVYGLSDYTKSTILQSDDIENRLPPNKKIIWFRDEGHINTNRWQEILNEKSYKIVNFSATNKFDSEDDIRCNFNHTMMLRSVVQQEGTPEDALEMLIKVKKQHSKVINYNPCAIFRILDDSDLPEIYKLCEERNLKCINISEDEYKMIELCDDANEYDVIINKFKIIEGIDIRRAHVIYMTNEPKNPATSIQVIGRCRRNALLYRDDIDIFDSKNSKLLESTRVCYAFYSTKGMNIAEDENGDLVSAFCDKISVQELKDNIEIKLKNGYLNNGLLVLEARKDDGTYLSGIFNVKKDSKKKFNVLSSKDTNIPIYNKKKIKFMDESTGELYAINNSIMDKNDLKKYNSRFSKLIKEHATPLKDVTKYWMKIEENGVNYFTNYGNLEFDAHVRIDWDELLKIKDSFLDESGYLPYNLKIEQINDKFRIEFSLSCCYSVFFKKVYNLTVYYNLDSNSFVSKEDATIFGKWNDAQLAKKKAKELANKFITGDIFGYNLSVDISTDSPIKSFYDLTTIELKYIDNLSIRGDLFIKADLKNKKVLSKNYKGNGDSFRIVKVNDSIEQINFKIHAEIKQHGIVQTKISEKNLLMNEMLFFPYTKITNDRESAIIGLDKMRCIRMDGCYEFIEDKNVTSKIAKYSKFKQFLLSEYSELINKCENYYYSGKNNFVFSKKCNSALGYLVEYYVKYLLYGEKYISSYLCNIGHKYKNASNVDCILYACIQKYKEMMILTYGKNVSSVIGSKMFSIDTLMKDEFKSFKDTIVSLANNCISFIRDNVIIYDNNYIHDPNLSIDHIAGLADIIDENTIIDIKCTSKISEQHILQLLGYYYLSTKRTDLKIKYLIVYDVVKNRYIKINMEAKEVTSNYDVN